jgi:DNA-binding NtrC family response regulator/HPt (histidine-containing phosphotransfer) domain-containing protein
MLVVDVTSKSDPSPDSLLEQLLSRYAANLPAHLDELRAAMTEAADSPPDAAAVTAAVFLAHRLAGTAGTLGFPDEAELGANCERVLRAYQAEGAPLPEWRALLAHTRLGRAGRTEQRPSSLGDLASDTVSPDTGSPDTGSPDTISEVSSRVLVIDDDKDFLTIIAEMLRQSGYVPITTTETADLANLIEYARPNLILLDVDMPGMDGFEACRSIRAYGRWSDIPIVFLTAMSTPKDRIAAFQAGGDDYINKPVVADELRARVDVRVDRARMARERQSLLEQTEQQRDSLLSLLDQLRIGTLLLDADGCVEFASHYCGSIGLDPKTAIGRHWEDFLPLDRDDRVRLTEQIGLDLEDRARLQLAWTIEDRRYVVECEVRDAPGKDRRRIVCLTDVSELRRLQQEIETSRFGKIQGKSAPMQELYRIINDVARGDWSVLIEGDTGVGKELVAHSLHESSPRKNGPFIAVNAAGLSESLLASQLFGHRKGSFTGAVSDQEGFFEAASGGTLFLDEIGDLPMSMQASLLRVLQEKEVVRVGETRPRKVDTRILAATHKDLTSEVREGRFRKDLLYRLRVARVYVPALRERAADIPLLAESFIAQSFSISGKAPPRLGPEATQCLLAYDWPGNVRELKAAIDYAVIHCRGERIDPADLPPEIGQAATEAPSRPRSELLLEPALPPETGDERSRLLAALDQAGGNRTRAAKLLGVSRATFYRRLETLGIPTGQ